MARLAEGVHIDYRHIIDSLIRKPGAFANYQYRDQLFPQQIFRLTYDQLSKAMPAEGHKHYLKILHLAKCHGEQKVATILKACQKSYEMPTADIVAYQLQKVEKLPIIPVNINTPNLSAYDDLHNFGGTLC